MLLSFITVKKNEENITIKRLRRIHKYYQLHPGCTINKAVTFVPETKSMVEKYSLIRLKLTRSGINEPNLTDRLERCEYNKNKL